MNAFLAWHYLQETSRNQRVLVSNAIVRMRHCSVCAIFGAWGKRTKSHIELEIKTCRFICTKHHQARPNSSLLRVNQIKNALVFTLPP